MQYHAYIRDTYVTLSASEVRYCFRNNGVSDQRTTSKDAGAETPQCAEGCTTFQFVPYSRVDGGRLVCSPTERSSGAADGHIVPHPQAAGQHERPF
jgi:hypothetical protein